jgi:hypothetical protein
LGLGLVSSGCANRSASATALTAVGAAAVIVGASLAADNDCNHSPNAAGPPHCSPGLSKSTRNAGTALAVAGVGAAAAGYALQPKGPDQLGAAPAPRAPTQPYRLIRRAPPAPAAEPAVPEVASPAPAPEASTGATTEPAPTSAPAAPHVEEPSDPAPEGERNR